MRRTRAGITKHPPGIRIAGRQPHRFAIKADRLVLSFECRLVKKETCLLHQRPDFARCSILPANQIDRDYPKPRNGKCSGHELAPANLCNGRWRQTIARDALRPLVASHPGVQLRADGIDTGALASRKRVHRESTSCRPPHHRRAISAQIASDRFPSIKAGGGSGFQC